MATVTETRLTPEDLLKITDRPMPELVDGEIVERETGIRSDAIAVLFSYLLMAHVRPLRLGYVLGAHGSYQIFPDFGKVRIPDVSFIRAERVPEDWPPAGHSRVAPDLAVEVVSPNDLSGDVSTKVEEYHGAGVAVVLVIEPDPKVIRVHRPDGSDRTLRLGDTLELADILPGFRLPVAELFA